MNCPSCGAAMRLKEQSEHWKCEFCGQQVFPSANEEGVRVLGGDTGLPCPVCRVALTNVACGKQRAAYCEQCRGLLFDVDDFLVAVRELRAARNAPPELPRPFEAGELARRVECPRCRKAMDTHPYAGPGNIVIDNCAACGLNWLDHGELLRIVNAPDQVYSREAWTLPEEKAEAEESDPIQPIRRFLDFLLTPGEKRTSTHS